MIGAIRRWLAPSPPPGPALFEAPDEVKTRRDSIDHQTEIERQTLTPGKRAALIGFSALSAYGSFNGQTMLGPSGGIPSGDWYEGRR